MSTSNPPQSVPWQWKVGLVLVACALVFALCVLEARSQEPSCQYPQPSAPVGTLYLTQNIDPAQNRFLVRLGLEQWNHAAIDIGDTDGDGMSEVVEAQSGPPYGYGVIRTPLNQFLARPYYMLAYWPRYQGWGERAAYYARCCVGRPYGRAASIGPGIVRDILGIQRENCTSVCEDAYGFAVGRRLWFVTTPDDLARTGIFYGPYLVTTQEPRP